MEKKTFLKIKDDTFQNWVYNCLLTKWKRKYDIEGNSRLKISPNFLKMWSPRGVKKAQIVDTCQPNCFFYKKKGFKNEWWMEEEVDKEGYNKLGSIFLQSFLLPFIGCVSMTQQENSSANDWII